MELLLGAAVLLLLLPIGMHARNGRSMTRRIALTKVRQSDWERPFLERLWVLSYAAMALVFLGLFGGMLIDAAGLGWLAVACWVLSGVLVLATIWLCVLPSYTVVKSWRRARDAGEADETRLAEK